LVQVVIFSVSPGFPAVPPLPPLPPLPAAPLPALPPLPKPDSSEHAQPLKKIEKQPAASDAGSKKDRIIETSS